MGPYVGITLGGGGWGAGGSAGGIHKLHFRNLKFMDGPLSWLLWWRKGSENDYEIVSFSHFGGLCRNNSWGWGVGGQLGASISYIFEI